MLKFFVFFLANIANQCDCNTGHKLKVKYQEIKLMDRENNPTLKLRQTLIKTMIVTAFTGNTVPVQSKVETLFNH